MKPTGAVSLAGAILVSGCSGTKPADGESTLKAAMDRYAAMKSFHVKYAWKETVGEIGGKDAKNPARPDDVMESTRELWVSAPDKYRVTSQISSHGQSATYVSVSSGKDASEYMQGVQSLASPNAKPGPISSAKSMMILHPMFCGSPINTFFAGSAGYDQLVDKTAGPVKVLGEKKLPNGKTGHEVAFNSAAKYGLVKVTIGDDDHLVYAMSYDNAGTLADMSKMLGGKDGSGPKFKMDTVETYDGHEVDAVVAAKVFDTTLPAGLTKPPTPASSEQPPVPIGKPAPDFEVVSLDGKKAKLSSFRGKVVLIDAWATWCGPCKEGLPVTQKLHNQFKDKGLVVMAISDEDPQPVSAFVKENKYTFPTYTEDGSMRRAYGISAIPTLIIVDTKGNLASYSVGLEPESAIRQALKKAGVG